MVEYLIRFQEHKQFFHNQVLRPEQGMVLLPEAPGLGIVLDEQSIEQRETLR
jgi:L-alanine-DL-glutamate epimerase-like enolase superfamily enzyme